MQPVREDRGCLPAGYAKPDRARAGTEILLRPQNPVYLPHLQRREKDNIIEEEHMSANVSRLLNDRSTRILLRLFISGFCKLLRLRGLDGFENWYQVQAQEAGSRHAVYRYLPEQWRGRHLQAIAKPEWERGDHMTPLKKALEHERLVTASTSTPSTPPHTRSGTSAPCRCWTGSLRSKAREEKNARRHHHQRWSCSAVTARDCMLNSRLKARVYTAPSLVLSPARPYRPSHQTKADYIQVACLFFYRKLDMTN